MEVEQEEEHFQLVATRVASVPRETSASTRQNVLQPTVIFYRSLRHFSKISDEPDPESFCHGFGRFNYYCQISLALPEVLRLKRRPVVLVLCWSMAGLWTWQGSCKPALQAPQGSHRSLQGITAQCYCCTVRHSDALLERTGGAHAPRRRLKAFSIWRTATRM